MSMYGVVSSQAVEEMFEYLHRTADPQERLQLLMKVREAISDKLIELYGESFYDLKAHQGWTAEEIADYTGVSKRKVLALIRWHIKTTDREDIMAPSTPKPDNVVDISSLVARKGLRTHSHPTKSNPKTLAEVFDEEAARVARDTRVPLPHVGGAQPSHDT